MYYILFPGSKRKAYSTTSYKSKKFHKLSNNKNNKILVKRNSLVKELSELDNVNENKSLKPFAGIQQITDNATSFNDADRIDDICEYDIDDDDWIPSKSNTDTDKKLCNALSVLMNNYESSDEQNNSLNIENNTKVIIQTRRAADNCGVINSNSTSFLENGDENDSPPEETVISKDQNTHHIEKESTLLHKELKKTQHKIPFKKIEKKRFLPSTLLQKLLSKEIRQERNVVLQCIRHIIKNNYFSDVQ